MNKFLIIQTASIGDVILITPLIETLHLNYPDADIDVLVKKGNESLFTGHPFVKEIFSWDKNRNKYNNLFSLIQKIRKENYTAVFNCQRFASSGLITIFSGAGMKFGFKKNPFSFFFTKSFPHHIGNEPYMHEVDRNLQLVSSLCQSTIRIPKLHPTPADQEAIEAYLEAPFLTVAPASLWFTKQFPAEKWIDFIRQIPDNYTVILLGGKNETDLCNNIITASGHKNSLNLAGKLSMLQSAALMSKALMNYVNDSAPLHFASAVNAPVRAVFCSTVKAFGFGPLSDDSAVIETTRELKCRPCGLHGHKACPESHFRCASDITIEQLLKTLPSL